MEAKNPDQIYKEFSRVFFERENFKSIKLGGLESNALPVSSHEGFGSHALFSDGTIRHDLSTYQPSYRFGHGHSIYLNLMQQDHDEVADKDEWIKLIESIQDFLPGRFNEREFFLVPLSPAEVPTAFQLEHTKAIHRLLRDANWFHEKGRVHQIEDFINQSFPATASHLDIKIPASAEVWDGLVANGIFGDKIGHFICLRVPVFISDDQLKDLSLRIKEIVN